MLTISYNNQQVPLESGFSIRMSWVNPVCFFDKIHGDAGIGIEIPVNEFSRAIFGNPERFEKYNATATRKFQGVEIRYQGVLLISGALNITSATTERYTAWLQSNLGVMGEAQQTKKVNEMAWPEDQTFVNKQFYDDDEDMYKPVTLINTGFWDGIGKQETIETKYYEGDEEKSRTETRSVLSRQFMQNHAGFVNGLLPDGTAIITTGAGCVVTPCIFLSWFIRESLRMNGWFIDRNDMSDPLGLSMIKNLTIYSNFNIVGGTMITQPMEIGYWDYSLNDYVVTDIVEITELAWTLEKFKVADLLPRSPYADMLLGIQNMLNFVHRFRSDSKVDIIDRNAVLSGTPIDVDQYRTGNWQIGERKDVRLKFVFEYDKNDAMFEQYEDLSDRWDDYGEPVDTVAGLDLIASPRMGELRLVRQTQEIYEYKWKVVAAEDVERTEEQFDALGWEFVSTGPQPFIYGTGEEEEEIKSVFSAVSTTGEILTLPQTKQKGNLAVMRSLWNDITPRLMVGNTLLWPNGLVMEGGDNSLFNLRWAKWAHFWKNRVEITGEFWFPMNILQMVQQNITGKFSTREGEFIIESMETEFGLNQIGKTTIKGYKI